MYLKSLVPRIHGDQLLLIEQTADVGNNVSWVVIWHI